MKPGRQLITAAAALACAASASAGQVREYNFTLSSAHMSKDGHPRSYLTINGDTPGPVIEGDEGDTIRIHVENRLLTETAIHWHGIYQDGSFWNDGVPGVTQWPIEARGSYTYEFTFGGNQTGAYFYHGHFGPVFADGHRGAIWIRPSRDRPRPYSLISPDAHLVEAMQRAEDSPHHLMTSDWYLETLDALILMFRDTGVTPNCAVSVLTNNRGRTTCLSPEELREHGGEGRDSMGCLSSFTSSPYVNSEPCRDTFTDYEVVEARDGDEYVFVNFIHTGVHHELRVSVDEHDMWVVAVDGDFVVPRKVNVRLLLHHPFLLLYFQQGVKPLNRLSTSTWESASVSSSR